jgi:hypothetical protein
VRVATSLRAVLVTTMWTEGKEDLGLQREEGLREAIIAYKSSKFLFTDSVPVIIHFQDNAESARLAVEKLLDG